MPASIQKLSNAISVAVALTVSPLPLQADAAAAMLTKSISYTRAPALEDTARLAALNSTALERLDPLVMEGFRAEAAPLAVHVDSIVYHDLEAVTIYDAETTLISDLDVDGFYHRFSVAIDADTAYSEVWIYARLYLSYEGGPWNYYASSTDFAIHGDSELDAFVIETDLVEGYPAGYYDIRIELYDADSGDWLLSYGPYDDGSLSALPLEDSVSDQYYAGVTYSTDVIVSGQGAPGLLFLGAFSLFGLVGRIKQRAVLPPLPPARRSGPGGHR